MIPFPDLPGILANVFDLFARHFYLHFDADFLLPADYPATLASLEQSAS
jgi:arginase family enzyme